MGEWILTLLILLPLAGAAVLLLLDSRDVRWLRASALLFSAATLGLSIVAVVLFITAGDGSGTRFLLEKSLPWLDPGTGIDIRYHVGLDAISLWLVVLTTLLTTLAIWASFSGIRTREKEYYAWMLVLETGMLGVFCSLDLLLFYVFFEFTLIPLFFIIGIWGGPQKTRAAFKFFIFTVAGSVLTFAGVLYLAWFHYTHSPARVFTLDIPTLTEFAAGGGLPAGLQWWLFLAFAAGFSIKVPLFPVHTWLPLAHTEAPTAGSVILAGVLLKLGSYGFVRLAVPLLPEGTSAFAVFMSVLAVCGIIYGALAAWVQSDIKKLVAYSSVSHMGFCMLGLFSLKMAGVVGSVLYMINHGLTTGALFLVVGMIYERYHTRDIARIGGLARQMPWMAFFLVVFTLGSIGLPGLNGFVSEFLVLLGTATSATTTDGFAPGPLGLSFAIAAATGIVLGAVYMLWMCERVLFGPVCEPPHTPDTSSGLKRDLTSREIAILAPIAVLCLLIGVWPKPLIGSLQPAVAGNILGAQRAVPAAAPVLRADGDLQTSPDGDSLERGSYLGPNRWPTNATQGFGGTDSARGEVRDGNLAPAEDGRPAPAARRVRSADRGIRPHVVREADHAPAASCLLSPVSCLPVRAENLAPPGSAHNSASPIAETSGGNRPPI